MAEQVLKFKSSKDHYHADACVVWCFDDRFYKLLKKFGKKQKPKFRHIDLVKVAGGAKALAEGVSPERDFLIGQIRTSIRLHGTKRVILMMHRDCGAFGGTKSFADEAAEQEELGKRLAEAREFVKHEVPGVPVDAYFADFDGMYSADPAS